MTQPISRRTLLAASAASALAAPPSTPVVEPTSICAFSKHFQWTDVATLSEMCAGFGFEGIDLTVRDGGHVLPERVAEDLPKAAEAIRKAGLRFSMITSHIVDARTPHAEAVVKTLAGLGVHRYRWGGFKYDFTKPIPSQLDEFKVRVKELAALNMQYGLCAMYHTHSGVGQVGASFWDLYLLLKDQDPNYVSVNYDIGHATVEGGYGGWIHSSRLLLPHTRGIAVKDFKWQQNAKGWVPGWCALGQGMVNFKQFLGLVKGAGFSGPLQLHYEYPELGGADTGKKQFTIPKEKLMTIFRRDLDAFKLQLKEAGLRS